MRLCAGEGATGKVDLVLCGHHHDRAEFRLGWDPGRTELLYHMDFFTENPAEYYRSHKKGFDKVHIQVENGAPLNGPVTKIRDNRDEASWKEWLSLRVPTRPTTLNSAFDARAWWERHRSLPETWGNCGGAVGGSPVRRAAD